jgi:hypothetical protein
MNLKKRLKELETKLKPDRSSIVVRFLAADGTIHYHTPDGPTDTGEATQSAARLIDVAFVDPQERILC